MNGNCECVLFAIRRQKRHPVLIRKHINNRRAIKLYKTKMRREKEESSNENCIV